MRLQDLVPLLVIGSLVAAPESGWPPDAAGVARAEQASRRIRDGDRRVAAELVSMADDVVQGKLAGGDAWLKWHGHFLRAPNGNTYVPFTIEIDEAPEGFQSVGMYVRVTQRGDTMTSVERRMKRGDVGFQSGEVPVSVPERDVRRRAPGTATAGEASAALRLLGEMAKSGELANYPFEDFHFLKLPAARADEARLVHRALIVPPGSYDLYVAVREREEAEGRPPRSAILKRALEVPDFWEPGLAMSSIILTDEIELLDAPLPPEKQIERPYALGTAQLEPARDSVLDRREMLTVVFMVYNAATDRAGKPDVTVDYVFHQQVGLIEQPFTRTEPQRFARETLPPDFNLRRGHQLAASQSVSLESFRPGAYRLEITVTDQRSSAVVTDNLRFTVTGGESDEAAARASR